MVPDLVSSAAGEDKKEHANIYVRLRPLELCRICPYTRGIFFKHTGKRVDPWSLLDSVFAGAECRGQGSSKWRHLARNLPQKVFQGTWRSGGTT